MTAPEPKGAGPEPPGRGREVAFEVSAEESGGRADVVLSRRCGVPRPAAQAALASGAVTVGRRRVKPGHRVVAGAEVTGQVTVEEPAPPGPEEIPLQIRYSDERVLVVSKPAGLVVHPAGGHRSGTLVNALLALGGGLSRPGGDRPGIVHRLDKDTSGLLLVARDDAAHEALTQALRDRSIHRHYLALVRGEPPARSGTVEAPVGRHPRRRRVMAVVAEGRPAVSHYRVLAAEAGAALLAVALETGRTHQIRVHLSHIGHPVLGDRAYGGASELADRLGLDRPWLHAHRLEFPHPDDARTISVTDPLPTDLRSALGRAGIAPP